MSKESSQYSDWCKGRTTEDRDSTPGKSRMNVSPPLSSDQLSDPPGTMTSLPGGKVAGACSLRLLHIVLRLRITGEIPPLHLMPS